MRGDINIKALLALGEELRTKGIPSEVKEAAQQENFFFTPENIDCASLAIANSMLDSEKITKWLPKNPTLKYGNCLIIMAGNIPMVGFFDMMCCLVLELKSYIKCSSKDKVLMDWIINRLKIYGAEQLEQWDGVTEVDAVIATGSNNALRYFEERFAHTPTLLRGNRTSAAVISGKESSLDIDALWHDIFDYYGLGCRSVTHLFIPEGYDIKGLIHILSSKSIDNPHYTNAYRQAKALAVMNDDEFIDGGYFLARSSASLTPPMAEVTYSIFSENILLSNMDRLQVVVGDGYTPYGEAQHPTLNDWADGVNIFNFLT